MKAQRFLVGGCIGFGILSACLLAQEPPAPPVSREVEKRRPPVHGTATPRAPGAWTLHEAMEQLKLYPRDAYLQYVALQLGRREKRHEEIGKEIAELAGDALREQLSERAGGVDLFSLFSGELAVQESLQLDTMTNDRPVRAAARMPASSSPSQSDPKQIEQERLALEKRRHQMVSVAALNGPTIQSHPWTKMLAGKKPEIGSLARCVPEDFYYVEFLSLAKLMDVLDLGNLWGNHLFSQAVREARTQLSGERIRRQLVLETNPALRPFYDLVVEDVALTGSDLFIREGSDVTILFRMRQPEVFRARMESFLTSAQKERPDARRASGECCGISYVSLTTDDHAMQVYAAYPEAGLHVRSNSLVALTRVMTAIRGHDQTGKAVPRLGDTDEFAYMRTLMPQGATTEDGFIYLSDPFIRRLVGPEVKLTERRRMLCYNHLRMIGHAAMLYRTAHGRPPASLEELVKAECTPGVFGQGKLVCPDGGTYSVSADGKSGICSHHGHTHALTPCCEIPVKEVTGVEADEYKAFADEYNQYWRTYFDPIAIRVQFTPQRVRLETIVLPLIQNSIYMGLAQALGGQPERLDELPIPKRNIFSVVGRFNREELIKKSGLVAEGPHSAKLQSAENMREITRAIEYYNYQQQSTLSLSRKDRTGKPLLSWRVLVLPYLGETELYHQFHLDEPWDSEHNQRLIAHMPAVYRCSADRKVDAGKTPYLTPTGPRTFLGDESVQPESDTRWNSHLIRVVDTDDAHAAFWTQPSDFRVDRKQPLAGLYKHDGKGFLAAFEYRVYFIPSAVKQETVQNLFERTPKDDSVFNSLEEMATDPINDWFDSLSISKRGRERLNIKDFVTRGLGNQIGLHVYDAEELFGINLPSLFGQDLGPFGGESWGRMLPYGFLIASLNAPAYVAISLQDVQIVGEFLARLDTQLAALARKREQSGFFRLEQDFYHYPLGREKGIRSYGFQYGPVKWRLHWGRVGNALYVASKPYIFNDLLALEAERIKSQGTASSTDHGPRAHAMARIRPQNWERVLPDYRLGWAENNRQACLNNLGPLSSLARALPRKQNGQSANQVEHTLLEFAEEVYGEHFYCPEGGHYRIGADGKSVSCTIHGSALDPHQPPNPTGGSPANKMLRDFTDLTVSLSFLDDGLHAVVSLERKK